MSMAIAIDTGATILPPDGFPLAIVVLSSIFLGLSVITVSLRAYTRVKKGTFGLDDAFIVTGTVSLL